MVINVMVDNDEYDGKIISFHSIIGKVLLKNTTKAANA